MPTSNVAKKDRGRERTSEKSGWELLPKHRVRDILTPQESDPMQHLPTGFQDCYRLVFAVLPIFLLLNGSLSSDYPICASSLSIGHRRGHIVFLAFRSLNKEACFKAIDRV